MYISELIDAYHTETATREHDCYVFMLDPMVRSVKGSMLVHEFRSLLLRTHGYHDYKTVAIKTNENYKQEMSYKHIDIYEGGYRWVFVDELVPHYATWAEYVIRLFIHDNFDLVTKLLTTESDDRLYVNDDIPIASSTLINILMTTFKSTDEIRIPNFAKDILDP